MKGLKKKFPTVVLELFYLIFSIDISFITFLRHLVRMYHIFSVNQQVGVNY